MAVTLKPYVYPPLPTKLNIESTLPYAVHPLQPPPGTFSQQSKLNVWIAWPVQSEAVDDSVIVVAWDREGLSGSRWTKFVIATLGGVCATFIMRSTSAEL